MAGGVGVALQRQNHYLVVNNHLLFGVVDKRDAGCAHRIVGDVVLG